MRDTLWQLAPAPVLPLSSCGSFSKLSFFTDTRGTLIMAPHSYSWPAGWVKERTVHGAREECPTDTPQGPGQPVLPGPGTAWRKVGGWGLDGPLLPIKFPWSPWGTVVPAQTPELGLAQPPCGQTHPVFGSSLQQKVARRIMSLVIHSHSF